MYIIFVLHRIKFLLRRIKCRKIFKSDLNLSESVVSDTFSFLIDLERFWFSGTQNTANEYLIL